MASPRRRPPCPDAPFCRCARREKRPTGDARLVFAHGTPPPCLTATFTAPRCPLRPIAALCLPCPETRLPCDFGGENARLVFVQGAPSPSPRGCPVAAYPIAVPLPQPPHGRRLRAPTLPLAHRCAALSSIPRPCLPRPVPSPAASPFAAPFPGGPFFRRRATFRATSPFFSRRKSAMPSALRSLAPAAPPRFPKAGVSCALGQKSALPISTSDRQKRNVFSDIISTRKKSHTPQHHSASFFFFKKSFSHNDIPLFFIFLYFHVHLSFQDIHYFHKIAFIMTKYA